MSRNDSVLGTYDGLNNPAPLELVAGGARSRFWRALPPKVQRDLLEKPYTMENHVSGVLWLFHMPMDVADLRRVGDCEDSLHAAAAAAHSIACCTQDTSQRPGSAQKAVPSRLAGLTLPACCFC